MKVTLLTLGKCTSVGSEHSWLTYLHFLFTHTLLYYECEFLWSCLIWGNFLSSWVTGIEIQVQKKTAVHVDSVFWWNHGTQGCPGKGEISGNTPLYVILPLSLEKVWHFIVLSPVSFLSLFEFWFCFSVFILMILMMVTFPFILPLCSVKFHQQAAFLFVASPFCMDFTFLSLSYS